MLLIKNKFKKEPEIIIHSPINIPKNQDSLLNYEQLFQNHLMILIFDKENKILFIGEKLKHLLKCNDLNTMHEFFDALNKSDIFFEDLNEMKQKFYTNSTFLIYTEHYGHYIAHTFIDTVNIVIFSDISVYANEIRAEDLIKSMNEHLLPLLNEMILVFDKNQNLLNNCVGKIHKEIHKSTLVSLTYGYSAYIMYATPLKSILADYEFKIDKQTYYLLQNSLELTIKTNTTGTIFMEETLKEIIYKYEEIFESKIKYECLNTKIYCLVDSIMPILTKIVILCGENNGSISFNKNCILKLSGIQEINEELRNSLVRNGYNFTIINNTFSKDLKILFKESVF